MLAGIGVAALLGFLIAVGLEVWAWVMGP
jgi:hypothetical protein